MCGRYTLISTHFLHGRFALTQTPVLVPRYNIAPTQPVPVIRPNRNAPGMRMDLMHWGLIPSWAKDPAIGNRLINARAESAPDKPAFRSAFKYRRCLLPADGFYEWKKIGRVKQPHLFRMKSGEPFAFAGLWEHWEEPGGSEIDSCTILTTNPNELVRPCHDRMPAIVRPEHFADWLNPQTSKEDLLKLLEPFPAEEMTDQPVGTQVNSAKLDDSSCVEPAEDLSAQPIKAPAKKKPLANRESAQAFLFPLEKNR